MTGLHTRIVDPSEYDGQLLAALRAMTAERDALRAENGRLRNGLTKIKNMRRIGEASEIARAVLQAARPSAPEEQA